MCKLNSDSEPYKVHRTVITCTIGQYNKGPNIGTLLYKGTVPRTGLIVIHCVFLILRKFSIMSFCVKLREYKIACTKLLILSHMILYSSQLNRKKWKWDFKINTVLLTILSRYQLFAFTIKNHHRKPIFIVSVSKLRPYENLLHWFWRDYRESNYV